MSTSILCRGEMTRGRGGLSLSPTIKGNWCSAVWRLWDNWDYLNSSFQLEGSSGVGGREREREGSFNYVNEAEASPPPLSLSHCAISLGPISRAKHVKGRGDQAFVISGRAFVAAMLWHQVWNWTLIILTFTKSYCFLERGGGGAKTVAFAPAPHHSTERKEIVGNWMESAMIKGEERTLEELWKDIGGMALFEFSYSLGIKVNWFWYILCDWEQILLTLKTL